jgi:hypothetical protein
MTWRSEVVDIGDPDARRSGISSTLLMRGVALCGTHENHGSWPCLDDPLVPVHEAERITAICQVDGTQTLYC